MPPPHHHTLPHTTPHHHHHPHPYLRQLRKLETDLLNRFKGIVDEKQSRRAHVDALIDGLRSRFTDTDDTLDRQRRELQAADRRRLEDMELVERAVAAVQEQVRRLNERITDGVRGLSTEVRRLAAAGRKAGADLHEVKADAAAAKAGIVAAGAESSHRFDSVSQVLRALTNAVAAPPPSLPAGHREGAGASGMSGGHRSGVHMPSHVAPVPPPVPRSMHGATGGGSYLVGGHPPPYTSTR